MSYEIILLLLTYLCTNHINLVWGAMNPETLCIMGKHLGWDFSTLQATWTHTFISPHLDLKWILESYQIREVDGLVTHYHPSPRCPADHLCFVTKFCSRLCHFFLFRLCQGRVKINYTTKDFVECVSDHHGKWFEWACLKCALVVNYTFI